MKIKNVQYKQLPMIFVFELPDNPTREDYETWLRSQISLMGEEFTNRLRSAKTEIYWHNESVVDLACVIFEPLSESQVRAVNDVFTVTEHVAGCFEVFWIKLPQRKSELFTYEFTFGVGDTIRLNENFWMSGKPYKSGGKMHNFPCVDDVGIVTAVFSDRTLHARFNAGASGYFIVSESECDLVKRAGDIEGWLLDKRG